MNSSESNLEQRVAELERQVAEARRLRGRVQKLSAVLALALLGAVTIAASLQPQAPEVPEVLQARRFEVVDGRGHVVVAATARDVGGQIDIWNAEHINVARLSVSAHGGDLAIWNREGKNVFGAFAGADGGEMGVWDTKGVPVLRGAAGDHGGQLTVHNAAGMAVVTATNDVRGAGEITVSDERGRPRFAAAVNQSGSGGETRLLGGDGVSLVVSGASNATGGGYVEIFNRTGSRVLTTATDQDGGGRLDLADAAGNVVFTADALADAGAALAVMNGLGQKIFVIANRPQGGLINLMNSQGQTILIAGTADEGMGGALSIKNGSGNQVLHAGYDSLADGLVTVWDAQGERFEMLTPRE